MPFTLSHPAAVLPLLRRPFVPSALVAGAMAPDIPYFIGNLPFQPTTAVWYEPYFNATATHTLTDLPTVALPLALGLTAAYYLLRAPAAALLPPLPAHGTPVPRPSGAADRARIAMWLVLSALIGIATHVVWDSFTHVDGYVVTRVELLRDPVPGGLTVARVLQHLSTVAGLVALAVHFVRRRRTAPAAPAAARTRPPRAVRWGVTAALALAAAVGAFVNTDDFDSYRTELVYDYSRPIVSNDGLSETYPSRTATVPWPETAQDLGTHAAKGAGSWLGGGLLLYAAAWHLRIVPRGRGNGTPGAGTGQDAERTPTASVP
ncbi:DUF4184 family protein [Streptomyces sp. NPDC003691]